MQRSSVKIAHHTIAYTDFGGVGTPVLALHGSFGRGSVFTTLAAHLDGHARIIAPDQRGHGLSDHTPTYTRDDFVNDAASLLSRLGAGPVVVLGHSSGGITAYQLAARHPDLVSALIIEDVGPLMRTPEIPHPVLDVRDWPTTAPTREALADAMTAHVPDSTYFMHSAVQEDDHWHLLFDWNDMMAVQEACVGDWWPDWLASTCPALVLHGAHSPLLPPGLAEAMTVRRADTRLVRFPDAGHWIHDDAPEAMARAIKAFLVDWRQSGGARRGSRGR
ncbi:pimeloyl-ACP methyl ester carboxylesterase [Saccharothrix tamanrassetensis]|uniref:Pimeloyl-ACP methyl ester carboxylesterase n=1 Tax=Saccharothrix tamanrassetensis TaxID=1051531 RepID=A0A841CBH8_9PSEU|nr:alpha/beta hydrolase [Saccharothrix tamanrassetensis]MBB5954303.1 pimeloyl-ACP methyl ester carboxylesterase [Saccharothrix tamanrassetensis]